MKRVMKSENLGGIKKKILPLQKKFNGQRSIIFLLVMHSFQDNA